MQIRHLILSASIPLLTSCTYNETTGEMETTWLFWALLFALIFIFIAAYNYGEKKEEAKRDRADQFNKAAEEFHVSARVVGVNNRYQFIVDDVDRNIIYMESIHDKKIVPFGKIMGVEMDEDNTIISSKSLGRTIGGALIGDLLGGRAGMIVGGLSGCSKPKKIVSKVEVTVKLRDLNDTAFTIQCFDAARETDNAKNQIKAADSVYGPMYKQGLQDAVKITELVSIIIDRNDNTTAQPVAAPPTQPSPAPQAPTVPPASIADEIKKLADMKSQGLITPEEYTALKSKLIN